MPQFTLEIIKGAKPLKWTKWHGAGNDFLIGEWSDQWDEAHWQTLIRRVADRHFGVGADGVMLVAPSEDPRFAARMHYYNSDGSKAAMCGNGIRCFASHLHRTGRAKAGNFVVLTDDGPKDIDLQVDGQQYRVRISMGVATFEADRIPVIAMEGYMLDAPLEVMGRTLKATALRVGVPHLIIEVETMDENEIRILGPALEVHPAFPQKTNVNFVRKINNHEIEVVTWERGAGLTLACGTGACASFYAFYHAGRLEREALVHVPGGVLEIRADDHEDILMTGPAEAVAEVETLF